MKCSLFWSSVIFVYKIFNILIYNNKTNYISSLLLDFSLVTITLLRFFANSQVVEKLIVWN